LKRMWEKPTNLGGGEISSSNDVTRPRRPEIFMREKKGSGS